MTNFIPIFPLGIVVYPGENLNLHIFEPRYKQLISECHTAKRPFGIPTVIDNRLQEYRSLVEISELTSVHENGEMDIKTKGIKIFRILEVIKEVPDKLYSGAIVTYPDNYESGNPEVMRKVMSGIRELHQLLKVSKDFIKEDDKIKPAHIIGAIVNNRDRLVMRTPLKNLSASVACCRSQPILLVGLHVSNGGTSRLGGRPQQICPNGVEVGIKMERGR